MEEKITPETKEGSEMQDMRALLERSIALSETILQQNKKIKHRITMMTIGNYLRLTLFIAPIILGIIFLPPLIAEYYAQLESYLGPSGAAGSDGTTSWKDIFQNLTPEQIQEGIRSFQNQKK